MRNIDNGLSNNIDNGLSNKLKRLLLNMFHIILALLYVIKVSSNSIFLLQSFVFVFLFPNCNLLTRT